MADAMQLHKARNTFDFICSSMDQDGWKYSKNAEKLRIETGAKGEDLPVDLQIHVDADRQLVMIISPLSVVAPEDKRLDLSIAVSMINNQLVHGCFDYDIMEGKIFYRQTTSICGVTMGGNAFMRMLYVACKTVDEYNDKLFMMAKGLLPLEKFMENESKA